MKTNFHASAKKRNKKGRVLLVVLIIVVCINVFDIVWPQSALRVVLFPMTALRTIVLQPFTALQTLFSNNDALIRERDALQQRVTTLELAELQASIDAAVETALRTERSYAISGVQLPVLMRPPFSPYDTLVLDARALSDIAIGDAVYTYGVLIGRVSEIGNQIATVSLYTSPKTTTVARIGTLDVSVVGQGGGRYVATVPKDVAVSVGDAVSVPEMYYALLGVVSSVDVQESGAFQDIHIALPVSVHTITAVTVVREAVIE